MSPDRHHGAGHAPRLRGAPERLVQTLGYEAGGLLLVTPLAAFALGRGGGESLALLALLSLVVMAWSALFNTLFDLAEWRLAGRAASERPPRWRAVHALAHEASAVLVTWPVVVLMTGLGWGPALAADLGLTLAYALWAYLYHLGYDAWRPVAGAGPLAGAASATHLCSEDVARQVLVARQLA